MLASDYRRLCEIKLPYKNRQKYMHSFDLSNPRMAQGFEDYLPIVISLCEKAHATKGIAHMTVDEKLVLKGSSQRRPHAHVDGCFMTSTNYWSHRGPDEPTPRWNHYCNNIETSEPYKRMPIIVASNVAGCRAWKGEFDGHPKNDGDLQHLNLKPEDGEILEVNTGYLLSPDCIHESMIMSEDIHRTFLRIALPVDFMYWN